MAISSSPRSINIRTYQVGFGDCFLLTFDYGQQKRYALIDFGTNGTPTGNDKEQLLKIATDIKNECNSKLHVVIATHRHKDHISGFSTDGKENPGKIIADCHPEVVIQPWTEDLNATKNAQEATRASVENFTAALDAMHGFAERALVEAQRLSQFPSAIIERLSFDGQNNLANKSAVQNLATMAKKNLYVNTGFPLNLEKELPGVKFWVLGPPTLKQSEGIKKERSTDPNEFWLQQSNFWKATSHRGSGDDPLFRNAGVRGKYPLATKWFVEKAGEVRCDQLFELVRILDKAMNNTSVILLMEVNGKRLLFPGDAQIENWSYALRQKKYTDLLRSVAFYKVGHHGSRNATPKSLWKMFDKKSATRSTERLKTILSTMKGKYGKTADTEVPRAPLIDELKAQSDFFTTQELTGAAFQHDLTS